MRPLIVHVATERGITSFRNTNRRGQQLGYQVVPIQYSELLRRTVWPRGMYLFTDMERATEWQCATAALLWQELAKRPEAFRLYNHPVHHLRRYGLLRALHNAGINDFNVYRLNEITGDVRYPVFVRYTDRHIGPTTDLIHSEEELKATLSRLLVQGHDPHRLIVVEFQDTSVGTGIHRKYASFRLGEHIYTGHMMASGDWGVKREINDRRLVSTADLAFVKSEDYADQVMEAFKIAGLTWGRIDFGVLDGRIQVWEINDNPKLGSSLFKRSMGRHRARRVSRDRRRVVWAQEMAKVVPGGPLEYEVPTELVARSVLCSDVAASRAEDAAPREA